jgi:hypothetical protein
VVSAILTGQRGINARQARVLAERFKVDAGVFLAPVETRNPSVRFDSRTGLRSVKIPRYGDRSPPSRLLKDAFLADRAAKGATRLATSGSKNSRTIAKGAKKAAAKGPLRVAAEKAGGGTRSAAKTGPSASRRGAAKTSSSRRHSPSKGRGPTRG